MGLCITKVKMFVKQLQFLICDKHNLDLAMPKKPKENGGKYVCKPTRGTT